MEVSYGSHLTLAEQRLPEHRHPPTRPADGRNVVGHALSQVTLRQIREAPVPPRFGNLLGGHSTTQPGNPIRYPVNIPVFDRVAAGLSGWARTESL